MPNEPDDERESKIETQISSILIKSEVDDGEVTSCVHDGSFRRAGENNVEAVSVAVAEGSNSLNRSSERVKGSLRGRGRPSKSSKQHPVGLNDIIKDSVSQRDTREHPEIVNEDPIGPKDAKQRSYVNPEFLNEHPEAPQDPINFLNDLKQDPDDFDTQIDTSKSHDEVFEEYLDDFYGGHDDHSDNEELLDPETGLKVPNTTIKRENPKISSENL